ncbi:MAG: 23S rRNA (guanosine(2251)-2'-O)-methyltransferase RlmB [Thermoanaerobaculia bacterium]
MRIYGYHPVREALRHRPHEVEKVYVAPSRGGSRRREIETLCARHRVTLAPAAPRLFAGLEEEVHNGFAAELRAAEMSPEAAGDADLVVLVEDVQDPRNLGALLRVCEGAGVGRVLIRDRGAAPLTPTVVKASAGAAELLPIERVTNSSQTLEELKEQGFWVYGVTAEGDPPWRADLSGKVLLCFGGEENGLRDLTRKRCDRLLGLPMRGRVESLNLATAAAAVLYEAVRQRSGS